MRMSKRSPVGAMVLAIPVLVAVGCGPTGDLSRSTERQAVIDHRGPTSRPYAITPDERNLLERIRAHLAAGLDINRPIGANAPGGVSPRDAAAARGETFLHVAAREGWVEAARLLLQNGARHDVRTTAGATPLHLACTGRQARMHERTVSLARIYGIQVARLLLAAGADVKVVDARERTPLHLACRSGDAELARLLLDKGADKNVVAMDENGRLVMTPLLEAALGAMEMPSKTPSGHVAAAMLLLERRAKVNLPLDGVEAPPLTWAAARGHRELASELIRRGVPVDAVSRNRDAWTALMAAADSGDALMVTLLLDAGADVNVHNVHGQTALSLARRSGHKDVELVLVQRGAKPQ